MKTSKTLLFIVFLISVSTLLNARTIVPNKKYVTYTVNNPKVFDAIESIGGPDIEYTQSTDGKTRISIFGSDNMIDLVAISVDNKILRVKYKENDLVIRGENRLKVIVSSPALSTARLKGSAKIVLKTIFRAQTLDLELSGSGDIEGKSVQCDIVNAFLKGSGDIELKNVNCRQMTASLSGSGNISLEGKAATAFLQVKGSGDINAKQLISGKTEAVILGSGDISCYAQDQLKARISGSGDIEYYGNPISVKKEGNREDIQKK
ncbi:head GIN domain-containing protein [Coprobacter tertius]|uniref:DUF2807 domain-containing protein n=1 Tax=Coprobacter tertius TaxID=2944915 RepID=A0ABT1MFU3_9BACT|nr:head GIN domain-containing protein [Coprobacter tertius]MCP9610736.1 DUF2807 domain-containing protein [Coprobacter tertius]